MMVGLTQHLKNIFLCHLYIEDESGPVNTLQKVEVVTLSNEHCKYTYGSQITDNMVCALGAYNEGICIVRTPMVHFPLL
jgi:hypothetical protein